MIGERITINLEEFLQYYIKKWKTVLLIIGMFVALFVCATKFFGTEIVVEDSEQYLYYEEKLLFHEEYLKDSVLMSIDPTSMYYSTVLLKNISDYDVLHNYVISTEIWNDFETERVKKYLPELVGWELNETTDVVEMTVRHMSIEESEACMTYLLKKIVETDSKVEIVEGADRVGVDEELQDLQNDWYNRINYLKDRLEEAEAGFTIQVNLLAAIISGAVVGVFASMTITLLMFMIKRKID